MKTLSNWLPGLHLTREEERDLCFITSGLKALLSKAQKASTVSQQHLQTGLLFKMPEDIKNE